MNVHPRSLLVVALLVLVSGCSKKANENEIVPFEGDWTVRELTEHGRPADAEAIKRLVVSVKGGQFQKSEVSDGTASTKIGGADIATLRVDTSKDPAEMELVRLQGADQGKTQLGIFVLSDTQLKICLADLGEERPTGLVASGKTTLMVLERKK